MLYQTLTLDLQSKIEHQNWEFLELCYNLPEGRGVFAAKDFKKGDFLCNYGGQPYLQNYPELVEAFQADNKYIAEILFMGTKLFFIHKDGVPQTWGKFINHSSLHPNVRPRILLGKSKKPEIIFVAKTNIAKGHQLAYTYGTQFGELNPCVSTCMICGMEQFHAISLCFSSTVNLNVVYRT